MEKNILWEVLQQAPLAFAYHKVLLDEQGEVLDYVFLEINKAFEEMTGLKRENILGKRVTEVFSESSSSLFDWLDFCGKAAMSCGREVFNHYSEPSGRWYKVSVFAPEKGCFVTVFQDISAEKEQINLQKKERQIQELNSKMDALFDSTQDAMFIVEVEDEELLDTKNGDVHLQSNGADPAQDLHYPKSDAGGRSGSDADFPNQELRYIEEYDQSPSKSDCLLEEKSHYKETHYAESHYNESHDAKNGVSHLPDKENSDSSCPSSTSEEPPKAELRYIKNNAVHQELTGYSLEYFMGKTPVELAGEEIGKTLEANYRQCIEAKKAITFEENLDLPAGERTWLTSLTPVIADQKVRYLVGSKKDITLQKNTEKELKKRLKYEKMISYISLMALREKSLEAFLNESLRLLGEGMEVSRSYIFTIDRERGTASNSFEWTAEGIASQQDFLQEIPIAEYDWWMDELQNRGVINHKDIEDIPDEKTKDALRPQNIKSLLVLPIFVENDSVERDSFIDIFWGFVGFDECLCNREWLQENTILLQHVTNIFSQYIMSERQKQRLWQENQRFKAIANSTEDVVFELDKDQRYRLVFGKWIGKGMLEPEFYLGKSIKELYGEKKAHIHEDANLKALAGKTVIYEWSLETDDGVRYYQSSLSPIWGRDGEVTGIAGIGRDITSLIKLQQSLQKEKELLNVTLESIGDGVVTTDGEGNIQMLNKVAQQITGWREEEAKDRPFSEVFRLFSEVTGRKVENPVIKVLKKGKVVGLANHTVLITKDERHVPIADSAAPIKDEKEQTHGVVMVFRDVTQEREHQEKILYMSYHDALTGLYNRRFIEEEMQRLDVSRQLPLSVIMADINGLKLLNDVFGHKAGDDFLVKAAEILKENCRREDIVARWGGDEFLILLPQTTSGTAEGIVQRIVDHCAKDCVNDLQVSMALGYAVKTKPEKSLQVTVKEAEEWMYRKKLIEGKSHRNNIINTMMATLYEKSHETREHVERLKNCCSILGKELKLSSKELNELILLATLHDIGKVNINESILKKPGPLTPEEWKEVKKHPEIGYRIVQNMPELASVAKYILSHHEHWDGGGYPRGLKGKEIPLLSRILAVVDAYDAMTNDRAYRKALSREEAIEEIKRNSGTQFDPAIVAVFLNKCGK